MNKVDLAVESVKDIIALAYKKGEIIADPLVRKRRLDICKNCKFYKGMRCSECGCVMKVKASLAATKCPLGIWDAKMVEALAMGDLYDPTIDEHLYKENCCGN